MKSIFHILSLIYIFILLNCGCTPAGIPGIIEPRVTTFSEIWGYLMKGEEKLLRGDEPYTHIFYFSASLNAKGRIPGSISRPDIILRDGYRPDIHLVITELSNSSLSHFALNPEYSVRDLLLDDICRVSEDFDGIQLDFESVLTDDAESFRNFLAEIRKRAPSKMLSIAVPARTKDFTGAYSYPEIAPLVDRMVIMAYDEHWSTSPPGPVASLPWCAQVAAYAGSVIDNEKIIMGLPLYGRAWQDISHAKAYRYSQIEKISADKRIRPEYKSGLGPSFSYSEKVRVSVFYDDRRSLSEKLRVYKKENINAVSFWRIGQAPGDLWGIIKAE